VTEKSLYGTRRFASMLAKVVAPGGIVPYILSVLVSGVHNSSANHAMDVLIRRVYSFPAVFVPFLVSDRDKVLIQNAAREFLAAHSDIKSVSPLERLHFAEAINLSLPSPSPRCSSRKRVPRKLPLVLRRSSLQNIPLMIGFKDTHAAQSAFRQGPQLASCTLPACVILRTSAPGWSPMCVRDYDGPAAMPGLTGFRDST
jgi:hypothetical protein